MIHISKRIKILNIPFYVSVRLSKKNLQKALNVGNKVLNYIKTPKDTKRLK